MPFGRPSLSQLSQYQADPRWWLAPMLASTMGQFTTTTRISSTVRSWGAFLPFMRFPRGKASTNAHTPRTRLVLFPTRYSEFINLWVLFGYHFSRSQATTRPQTQLLQCRNASRAEKLRQSATEFQFFVIDGCSLSNSVQLQLIRIKIVVIRLKGVVRPATMQRRCARSPRS